MTDNTGDTMMTHQEIFDRTTKEVREITLIQDRQKRLDRLACHIYSEWAKQFTVYDVVSLAKKAIFHVEEFIKIRKQLEEEL